MKMSKAEGAAVLITAIILSLALGFYIGRSTVTSAVVVEAAPPEVSVSVLPSLSPVMALPDSAPEASETEMLRQDTEEVPDQEITYPLDLNTADQAALETLPKIGPVLAERIMEYRSEQNGFVYVEELMNVEGIGEAIYQKIKDFVEVRN